ncbi:putative transcriptional regulator [Desulfosporosinus orientis DSM 765]|uniref:Putative transcriptional regulator n=1 Tax=Desulfosporosinus orientis (strain ATCC 19365 / DSM 765 / NCIMB 8382 / VKM B-1628 / Singapore I) TaxID=768706 RepID=G7WEF8_DESOD|nr:helix-turn-helix domain-containing protein [Desulfosporosinus orientis]AET70771.1 putative transcriptional regulator [Desulfosporosinus orientis DSM 765]
MIGKLLSELRNRRGLTQDQVADALGVKRPRYNSWENDIAKPDIQMLKKIAEFHNVTPDYLLGFEPNSSIPPWATAKDKRDFKKMLEDDGDLMFDGVPINQEDRIRVLDVLTGLFWEAKHMNKRKKTGSTYDTEK